MGIKKICGGCGRLLGHGEKCGCSPKTRTVSTEKLKFYKSYKWQKLRNSKVKETPYCVRCWNTYKIITTENLQGHHLLPFNTHPHLKLDDLNVTVLCRTCNVQLGDSGVIDWNVDEEVRQYIDNNK